MKNLFIFILFVFAAFAVVNNLPTLAPEIKQQSERMTISFRYAELYAREPEAKINIPIRKVKINQIADTFDAPRGVDRQHKGQDIFAPRNTPVYSATGGYVWRIGENRLGGNTVLGYRRGRARLLLRAFGKIRARIKSRRRGDNRHDSGLCRH